MINLPTQSSVIIIGAGPSGLMMAAQLLRFGIQPIIIDSKTEITRESRALAVQARSLEILRQMGLDEIALKEGNIAKGLILHQDTEEIAQINLSSLGEGKSAFPYVLILEQAKTERILVDYLTSNTCPVYWNTKLLDVHQTDRLVTIKIHRNNQEQLLGCDWLIAADGASSNVRQTLKVPFVGRTYQHSFFLADLKINEEIYNDAVRAFFTEKGFTAIFPMKGSNYRVIGTVPKALNAKTDISFNDLRPYLTFNLGFPITEQCCNWFSIYKVHHKMAERFKIQRCFLIGDAAHIHSPAGGQGMNTGLQDAYNLAWKLAGVINKKYSESILDTYAKERMPVAKTLLKTTDRLFSVMIGQNWLIRTLRNLFLPLLGSKIWKTTVVNQKVFGLISQTWINYRESSLSLHHSNAQNIKAGDRLPYIKFYDEKLKQDTDLHAWCKSAGFNLIVIGQLSQRELLAIVKWIKLTYPLGLNFFYMPPSKRNQHVFDTFEINENGRKALIIRPDMYIGYMNDIVDIELLNGYLAESISWR
ncbi:FAD-dependent monooxygenase [Pedobacter sp. P351]|uniref:FAD-dependent oxidoreductase n=1 Tax=Pedobacter superstes TaxID=3133441 RepID=UPI0030A03D9E